MNTFKSSRIAAPRGISNLALINALHVDCLEDEVTNFVI